MLIHSGEVFVSQRLFYCFRFFELGDGIVLREGGCYCQLFLFYEQIRDLLLFRV